MCIFWCSVLSGKQGEYMNETYNILITELKNVLMVSQAGQLEPKDSKNVCKLERTETVPTGERGKSTFHPSQEGRVS